MGLEKLLQKDLSYIKATIKVGIKVPLVFIL